MVVLYHTRSDFQHLKVILCPMSILNVIKYGKIKSSLIFGSILFPKYYEAQMSGRQEGNFVLMFAERNDFVRLSQGPECGA